MTHIFRRWLGGLRRALRLFGRPARRARGLEGVVVQPYRGYGSAHEIFLMGRVFRQPRLGRGLRAGTVPREVADLLRRLTRWGLGGVEISARLDGVEERFTTDRDGYFRVLLRPPELDRATRWHRVELDVRHEGARAEAEGLVYVPPPAARFVVVSDIDDTVMYTGVANRLRMFWRLFMQDAESRVAFPGVAALHRALHAGVGGDEGNPILYVSRGPWSIYEVLEAFFRLHRIPVGPVLFLREWGLTLQRPFPRKAVDHKRDLIEGMLRRYPDLPFVLFGDSGQHDPELYAGVVARHPGRIRAVYIRDVSRTPARAGQIRLLARETAEAGTPLVLADDTRGMAEHAEEIGLVPPGALDEVAEERAELGEPDAPAGASGDGVRRIE